MPFPSGHKTYFYFDYVMVDEHKAICMRIETALGVSTYYFRSQTFEPWQPISRDTFHAIQRPDLYGENDQ